MNNFLLQVLIKFHNFQKTKPNTYLSIFSHQSEMSSNFKAKAQLHKLDNNNSDRCNTNSKH